MKTPRLIWSATFKLRLLDRLEAAEAVCRETERIVRKGQGDTDVWDAIDKWRDLVEA